MDKIQTKRHFTYLTVLILSVVAINAVGWGIYAEKSRGYYDLINVSGKQRMLTQRIAYFATRGNLDQGDIVQLQNALDLIKTNHLKFSQGADEFNLDRPQPGDKFHELYFGPARLDKGIHQLIKAVQAYVDSEGSKRPFNMTSTIPNQLLSKTNLAVELYLAYAKEETQQILNWLIMLNFILLIAILIQLSLIYKAVFNAAGQLIPDVMTTEDNENIDSPSQNKHSEKEESQTGNGGITKQLHGPNGKAQHQSPLKTTVNPAEIKVEYKSDTPHLLECKRLLFVNCPSASIESLCSELTSIVGTDLVFCDDQKTALEQISESELRHRPFDIVFSSTAEDFESLQKAIKDGKFKQDYCHLWLCEECLDDMQACIQFGTNMVADITEAYSPYKSLFSHQLPEYKQKQLLLVDDNEINLMVLEGMVQKCEANCVLARDGQQALELAKNHKFDLIFMDLQMPVMNGYESAEKILFETDNNDTPIVAVTANHDYSDRKRCVEIGMVDCEAKPVHHSAVEKILYKYLS